MRRGLVLFVSLVMLAALGVALGNAGEASGGRGGGVLAGAAERLPVLEVSPADGSRLARPDTALSVRLDSDSPFWPRFRQQFLRGAFDLRLQGPDGPVAGLVSYDREANVASFRPFMPLRRYSAYTAVLAVKADLRAHGNQSGNASVSFGFRTGSDLHEPVRFELGEVSGEPTVLEQANMTLRMTDDYGLPAHGARVEAKIVSEGGARMSASASVAVSQGDLPGQAIIAASDREKELVTLEVSVSGPFGLAYRAERKVAFRAGPPAGARLTEFPQRVVVDEDFALTARIDDVFGNPVEDGERISLRVGDQGLGDQGSKTAVTSGGIARFTLRAPRKAGLIGAALEFGGISLAGQVNVTVLPGPPSQMSLQVTPTDLQIGQPLVVSGSVSDSFGNPTPEVGVEVQVTGSLTGAATLKAATAPSGLFTAEVLPSRGEQVMVSATVPGTAAEARLPVPVLVWEAVSGGRALTVRAIGSDHESGFAVTALAPGRVIGLPGSFAPGKWVAVKRSDGALLGYGQAAIDGSVTLTTHPFTEGDVLRLEEVASSPQPAPQPIKKLLTTAEGRFWPGSGPSATKYVVRSLSIPKSSVPAGATLKLEGSIWPYAGAGWARLWMEVREGTDHYFIDLWAEGYINRDYFNWQAAVYAEVK